MNLFNFWFKKKCLQPKRNQSGILFLVVRATRTAHPGHRPWPPWRQNETCGRRERRGAPMGKVPPGCEEEPKDPDVPAAVIFLLGCDGRRLLGLEGGQGAPGPCSDPDVALWLWRLIDFNVFNKLNKIFKKKLTWLKRFFCLMKRCFRAFNSYMLKNFNHLQQSY